MTSLIQWPNLGGKGSCLKRSAWPTEKRKQSCSHHSLWSFPLWNSSWKGWTFLNLLNGCLSSCFCFNKKKKKKKEQTIVLLFLNRAAQLLNFWRLITQEVASAGWANSPTFVLNLLQRSACTTTSFAPVSLRYRRHTSPRSKFNWTCQGLQSTQRETVWRRYFVRETLKN